MTALADPIADPVPPRERRRGVTAAMELGVLAFAVIIAIGTYFVITGNQDPQRLLTAPMVALLLVANLVPGVMLLVLIGRRIAYRRAARSPVGGGGKLHVRLVAIFSVLATVPMLLVTIFASVLFQSGVEFWFSDRARGMLENAQSLAQESYRQMLHQVDSETVTMAGDLAAGLRQRSLDDMEFQYYFAQQVYYRSLNEAVIFTIPRPGEVHAEALVNPYERDLAKEIDQKALANLKGDKASTVDTSGDRIRAITRLPGSNDLYLYAARISDLGQMSSQTRRAEGVLADYHALLGRSRSLQLQFNVALLLISLFIVGLAVWVALEVADRLVRPVGELVDAARRIAGGDLTARVEIPRTDDEIGTLGTAFNRMTGRLQEQTNALVTANAQLDSRRALIEAVLSGVSAGVISIDGDRCIRLINASATALLRHGEASPVGHPLAEVAPELDHLLDGDEREGIVQISVGGDPRTLAVKITRDEGGQILTFDDITQQLLDQRRAAWSDVARRIAHEIKNPLTPIQLAAERLQRRYGKTVDPEDGVFARLTDTIVRQVGDLRRMVDEFSSFARMPKPLFRQESLHDIARQALFLHEVAHPAIRFTLDGPGPALQFVCDRRQLGQALTNVVKNAVEAIEAREGEDLPQGFVAIAIRPHDHHVTVEIADNGIGLPIERDRIVEPYMTTRSRGTGLGLAIVKKIVEEHFGTIAFADRPGGGTIVTFEFDAGLLANLASAGSEPVSEEAPPAMLTRTGAPKA